MDRFPSARRTRSLRRGARKGPLFLLLLVVLAVGLLAAVDIRIRPMLKTYGVNQATTAATRAVNDAAQRLSLIHI